MNKQLLKETISLLKEAKLEHCSSEDSMAIELSQAIENLEKLQESDSSDKAVIILSILGKVLYKLPEIKEFFQSLGE
ncbi:MAG: hypothetical protein GQ583_09065 [Methyloprofundus sp.]|nr:hypothetical protein [Methyloprofundus sp.]